MWPFGSSKKAQIRIGAIVDVSDSRIEVALVRSESSRPDPNVIWTHVEPLARVPGGSSEAIVKKAVNNAFAAISKDAIKVLKKLGLPESISLIQASLHAPFAVTVSRSVSLQSDKPLKVTRSLAKELEEKAKADAYKIQSSTLVRSGLKLHPLSSAVTALRLNGYETKYPWKSNATEVTLSQHVILATLDFLGILRESRDKYLPGTELDADSFISLFFRTVSAVAPKVTDCSIVTIGDSATEFLTVRDGLPQDTYFMPFGLDHLSGEISRSTGLLPHEAKGLTKNDAIEYVALQSEDKKRAATTALANFENELRSLLGKTGDSLSLPKPIFLQTECDHELFFAAMVDRVSKEVTGTKHTVHPVTSEFFACRDVRDASLLSLAFAFHKKLYEDHYLDLD